MDKKRVTLAPLKFKEPVSDLLKVRPPDKSREPRQAKKQKIKKKQ